MHVHTYTMKHTHMHTIHIQTYIHIDTYAHIHTYIHTHTERERTLVRGHIKTSEEIQEVLPNTWHVKDG